MKMNLVLLAAGAVGLSLPSFGVENLVKNGDMNDEKAIPREVTCSAGKMTVGVEDLTWNKYVRLEVDRIARDAKTGAERCNACARIGSDASGEKGFPLQGGELYEYSIDFRGTSPRLSLSVAVETSEGKTVTVRPMPYDIKGLTPDWVRQAGTFRTPPEAKSGRFVVTMYWESSWGGMPYKVGDYVDFDNVRIAIRSGRFEEFAAKYDKPFAVAPIPVTTDMHLPFMPEELFDSPSNIVLTVAGRELRALPIALANMTDETEEYRVTLETTHPSEKLTACDGRKGLNGFPSGQVTIRRGVVVKDKDPSLAKTYAACGHKMASMKIGRLIDPLVELDDASVLAVPPRSARLVWIDFDTTGVPAGSYEGILRVVPLSAAVTLNGTKGKYHEFTLSGDMRDIPVTLNVLPFELPREPAAAGNFYAECYSEAFFRELLALGCREFKVSPWAFQFEYDETTGAYGRYKASDWEGGNVRAVLANYRKWAAAAGVRIRPFVAYGAYYTFKKVNKIADADNTPETMSRFGAWLKAVKGLMNECGFPDGEWTVELWDEPNRLKVYDAVVASAKAAQEAIPDVTRIVTFNYNPWTPADFEAVAPYLNGWIFYDGKNLGYNWPEYGPVIEKLIARGDYVSHYTCSTKVDEDLDKYYRQNAWQAERYGLTGNALFEATSNKGGVGATNWKCVHTGGIVYRAYDSYIPSVRSLALRQGVEDVKYLKLLRMVGGDDPVVQDFLKAAAKRVTDNPTGGDRRLADRVRDEAAALILKKISR